MTVTARDQQAVKPPWAAIVVILAKLDLQEQNAGVVSQIEGNDAVFWSGFKLRLTSSISGSALFSNPIFRHECPAAQRIGVSGAEGAGGNAAWRDLPREDGREALGLFCSG
jgi:hypothetical protein